MAVQGKHIYSGWVTTNHFYWSLFLNDVQSANVPLLIYLRGELGLGSTMRAYTSFGPLIKDEEGNMKLNNNSLTKDFHLLTIDFPCGTGFITEDSANHEVNLKQFIFSAA